MHFSNIDVLLKILSWTLLRIIINCYSTIYQYFNNCIYDYFIKL